MARYLYILLILLALPISSALAEQAPAEPKPKGWIMEADSDVERFELIQRYLRGFDQPMWEVGERYRSMHEALTRANYDLAAYHWKKIRTTIVNGYLKRPKRRANADLILLDKAWQEVNDAIRTKDAKVAWAGFDKAKNACMACHAAEAVPYMNDQPLFELSSPKM